MCMRKSLLVAVPLALLLGAGSALAAEAPGLGKPVTEADLALWDISIGPDGAGLPPGSGTPAQGAVVYAQKCELCHGKEGQEGRMPRSAARNARSPITCRTRRRSLILRGGRCHGRSQNRSAMMKSMR